MILVTTQSKAWVCGRLFSGTEGPNGCLSLVSAVCCVSKTGITQGYFMCYLPASAVTS